MSILALLSNYLDVTVCLLLYALGLGIIFIVPRTMIKYIDNLLR